jgi:hypothetical protein
MVAAVPSVPFGLADDIRVKAQAGEARFTEGTDKGATQGISPGWASSRHVENIRYYSLNIDGVPDGDYALKVTANAQRVADEDEYNDNTTVIGLRITGDAVDLIPPPINVSPIYAILRPERLTCTDHLNESADQGHEACLRVNDTLIWEGSLAKGQSVNVWGKDDDLAAPERRPFWCVIKDAELNVFRISHDGETKIVKIPSVKEKLSRGGLSDDDQETLISCESEGELPGYTVEYRIYTAGSRPTPMPTPEEIAIRAYEIFMHRASTHDAVEDWLEAERQLKAEAAAVLWLKSLHCSQLAHGPTEAKLKVNGETVWSGEVRQDEEVDLENVKRIVTDGALIELFDHEYVARHSISISEAGKSEQKAEFKDAARDCRLYYELPTHFR